MNSRNKISEKYENISATYCTSMLLDIYMMATKMTQIIIPPSTPLRRRNELRIGWNAKIDRITVSVRANKVPQKVKYLVFFFLEEKYNAGSIPKQQTTQSKINTQYHLPNFFFRYINNINSENKY